MLIDHYGEGVVHDRALIAARLLHQYRHLQRYAAAAPHLSGFQLGLTLSIRLHRIVLSAAPSGATSSRVSTGTAGNNSTGVQKRDRPAGELPGKTARSAAKVRLQIGEKGIRSRQL